MDLDNKKTEQQIEEEIINAYLNQLDVETPDLWDRIEAGLDVQENANAEHRENIAYIQNKKQIEQKRKKSIPVKWITTGVSLAAVLLAAILVIPYLTDNQKNSSDSVKNNGITNPSGTSSDNSVPKDESFQYEAAENIQADDESDSVYEDTKGNLTQIQDQTNGSSTLPEETVGSDAAAEQSILCNLKVLYEADGVYHCEIISIDENPYDLVSEMEIDVICVQGVLQVSQDMYVQVEISSRQEDGCYVVFAN